MAGRFGSGIDRIAERRALRRWRRAADAAPTMEPADLKRARGEARVLRREIDRVLHAAEGRLGLSGQAHGAIQKPLGTDWAWRPELWTGPVHPPGLAAIESRQAVGSELTVFHDCRVSELSLRQVRNTGALDLAPFGLRMDVFAFDGSFLSLVLNLPEDAASGLTRRHLLGLRIAAETEKPLELFARLNVRHGPNTEQLVREIPLGREEAMVEFDLGYSDLNEKRVEQAWIDLIFEGPELNQILIRDLTFTRRRRAEL
ncbi:DUF6478 family protein [Roseicyclus sp. F158]|uniref:DUF6478 family protein n=1 Tax=Tropicimonas omnivorans TaxID=3075590 RepID=A0ABU3DCV2_9RHOB|nr:DUF6478 family protein [Roseicyclus sp. F158]MDT0681389.1 DUF6478 family protein [Roseicyclus sp. F158]